MWRLPCCGFPWSRGGFRAAAAVPLPFHWPWLTKANGKECLSRRPEMEGKTTGASEFVRARKVLSGGVAECFKAEAKVTAKNTHGFKTARTLELALYSNFRTQQEPIPTHRFFQRAPFLFVGLPFRARRLSANRSGQARESILFGVGATIAVPTVTSCTHCRPGPSRVN